MNPGNCGRCMPCNPCACPPSCCPEDPRDRFKLERYYVPPNLCSIFGGHDVPYYHDRCMSPRSKQRAMNLNKNTLGTPVGLLMSSLTISSPDSKEVHSQRFATYLKAFAQIFLTPETNWNSDIIDDLLKEGQVLYQESMNMNYSPEDPDDIETYNDNEIKIKRSFDLQGYTFTIELDRYSPNNRPPPPPDSQEGEEEEQPPPIYLNLSLEELRQAIKTFFRHAKYCLITSETIYILVWKAKGVFFIFDFYGRTPADLNTDLDRGRAMLICVRTLENVIHLVTNLSGLIETDPISLREMKVIKLTQPDGKTLSRDYVKRVNQYEIISSDYAYLKATLHLTLNRADPVRNRSALPTGIAALIASKIDHPATWNNKMLDKLMCFGLFVCRQYLNCMTNAMPLSIDQFPKSLRIGQFQISYNIYPRLYEGYWRCVPNYKQSDLMMALEQSFKNNENYLLLQIDNQVYAIWRKNTFIYLFDPYRHRVEFPNGPSAEDGDVKSATLRMFRSTETFFNIFNQILLQTNRTIKFSLHRLQITKIETTEKFDPAAPIVVEAEEDGDIRSLNETICFEEDETRCRQELEEVSDYEEEEIPDVLPVEPEPKSESESEEDMEEEEGGAEDFGVESSSSDDDDGGRGKRGRGGKSKGSKKKRNAKKPEKKDKGKGKGKGKGGKGAGGRKRKSTDSDDESKKKKKKETKEEEERRKTLEEEEKRKSEEEEQQKKAEQEEEERRKSEEEERRKSEEEEERRLSEEEERRKSEEEEKRKSEEEEKRKSEKAEEERRKSEKIEKKKQEIEKKRQRVEEERKRKSAEEEERRKSLLDGFEEDTTCDCIDGVPPSAGSDINFRTSISNVTAQSHDGPDGASCPIKPSGAGHRGAPGADGATKSGTPGGPQEPTSKYLVEGFCPEPQPCSFKGITLNPNSYPGYLKVPCDMAVVGSESGTYESICKLLRAAFRCADRVLTMTPWGNYVIFRMSNPCAKVYFLFDGCTCNVNRFRHLDLTTGTAGLLFFQNLHHVISYVLEAKEQQAVQKQKRDFMIDEICKQYCD